MKHANVIARVWGMPSLPAQLCPYGIVCRDADAAVAVIGIERDADLEMVRQLAMFPIVAIVAAARTRDNARRVVEAIELGVLSVLPADAPTSQIAAAVIELATHRGGDGADVHPFTAEMLVLGLRARSMSRTRFAITRREREVLELVVDGHTTADIAQRLGIGFHTAQTHLKNLFRKLDVGSRAAATSMALRHQLV